MTVRREWTQVDGIGLHARVLPAARASKGDVVLVHGLVVSSRYMLPLAIWLADEYRVLIPDLPGFGHSPGAGTLDVEALADAFAAWSAARALRQPHLVANSFGCQIAATATVRHPGRFGSLALIGPTIDPAAHSAIRQALRWLRSSPQEPVALNLVIARDYLDAGPRRALGTIRHALDDHIDRTLPQVTVPVRIIRGDADPIVPQSWAEAATRLARGRLTVIDGGHTLNFSRPAAVAATLLRGFDEVQAGSTDALSPLDRAS
jgi:pimeloyl-ACP methyl ester carboxylesterase